MYKAKDIKIETRSFKNILEKMMDYVIMTAKFKQKLKFSQDNIIWNYIVHGI